MKKNLLLVLSVSLCSLMLVLTLGHLSSNFPTAFAGSTDLLVARTPANQAVIVNDAADFTVTLTNTTAYTMTGINVVDPLISDCDATVGQLNPAASTQYSCSLATVTADLTAVITATGTYSPTGSPEPIIGMDSTTVTTLTPSIAVSKTAVDQIIASGDDANFTVNITNTGEVDLDLAVSDPLGDANCVSNAPASLAAGNSGSYSCTSSGVTADFVNDLTVTGTFTRSDSVPDTVQANDTAAITLAQAGLIVTHTLTSPFVVSGDDADFSVSLHNTGNVDLTLDIDNPNTTDCETQAPANISAGSIVSYSCTESNVTAPYTSDLTATGTFVSPQGTLVTANDSDSVAVPADVPGIDVSLSPSSQNVVNGFDATYTVNITNTGEVDLDLAISDPLGDANCVSNAPASLAAGSSDSYSCTSSGVTADFVNSLTVTGTYDRNDATTDTVQASDTATVIVVNPSISVSKTTTTPLVRNGENALFDIEIENTGDVALDLDVSDPLGDAGCETSAPATIAANDTVTYSCQSSGVTADFTNVIDVTGTYIPTSGVPYEVTAQDSVAIDVINPAISISMTPDSQIIQAQGTAVFTIQVENIGDVTLTNVNVNDPLAPDCNEAIGTLAPGASTSYACNWPNVAADAVNQATAFGTDPINRNVSASDTASIDVINPNIQISITPQTQEIASGATANFTVLVENIGDATLTNVAVNADVNSCDRASLGTLTAGQSTDYTCSATNVTSSVLVNNATVTSRDPLNFIVDDSFTAFVVVNDPAIDIEVTPYQVVRRGNTAFFDVIVSNTGEVDLTDINVSNSIVTSCNRMFSSIAEGGADQIYRCSRPNTTAPYTNVASVTAMSDGGPVTSSTTSTVELLAVDLSLTPVPAVLEERGDTVLFNVLIENSGSVEITTNSLTSSQLGNLTSGSNNNISNSTCSNGVTILPGNFLACSFESEVTGQPGSYPFNATVVVEDAASTTVNDSAQTSVTLTDVASSMTATLMSAAGSMPEPGGTAVYTVQIDNTSPADVLTLDSLTLTSLGNLNNRGNCSLPQTIAIGGNYQCTFSTQIAGDAGQTINRTLSASATDDDGANVSDSDTKGIFISDVGSSIELSLSADKMSVPEPGDSVIFTVRVDNTSAADAVTINSINEPTVGELDGQGSCNLPVTVPAGQSYTCTFSVDVSGQEGDSFNSSIVLIGRDDDDASVQANANLTISIEERPLTFIHLPIIQFNAVNSEPNNNCADAFTIAEGFSYQFLADDTHDWYRFDLASSGNVTVEFTNFVPERGQIVIYAGNNCNSLGTVTNNGDTGADKTIGLGVVQAGTYYILIINDGAFDFQNPYNLRIVRSSPR